jgi:hypothetical protein
LIFSIYERRRHRRRSHAPPDGSTAAAGVTVSEATAQMFDPADPDRPVKAFL